jgi:ferric-dicitrate binding protein FerR (iron transport regulator)
MNQELIHKYLKGEALPQEKLDILAWIEASAENRKQFMQFRRLYDSAIWSESTKESANHELKPQKRSFAIRFVREFSKVAAVIAIAVTTTLFIQKSNQYPIAVSTQTIEVPKGQHVNLTLSDGTKVSLNSNSKFKFPSNFEADNRTVTLDGEGYFEVTHNTQRPFHVLTKKCDIKVLGTTFNVLAYNNSTVFETSLLHGSVKVTNIETSENLLLKPNERAEFKNGKLLQTSIESENDFLWRKGIYVFNDEPLKEIFQKLESYYQTKIIIQNKEVGKLNCTGKFRQIEGLEHVMRVLQKANSFEYKRNEENNTIVIL